MISSKTIYTKSGTAVCLNCYEAFLTVERVVRFLNLSFYFCLFLLVKVSIP